MSVPEAVAAAIARRVRDSALSVYHGCNVYDKIVVQARDLYVRANNHAIGKGVEQVLHDLAYAQSDSATAPTAIRISEALEYATTLPMIEQDNDEAH